MEIGSRATKPVALNRRRAGLAQDPAVGREHRHPERRTGEAPANQSLSAQYDEPMAPDVAPYDALLLVSFGGPEGPEDVVPFLENVTRGRGIPRERLEEVGAALLPLRRPVADQRPEPRVPRRAARGLRRRRASTCRSTGATATGTRT